MRSFFAFGVFFSVLSLAIYGTAPANARPKLEKMQITVEGLTDGQRLNPDHAYCIATKDEKQGKGKNISPAISWSAGPPGTKSYAIIMLDRDVPGDFSKANKDGITILETAPRKKFYHWVVVNIPVTTTSIPLGAGKSFGVKDGNGKAVINDFSRYIKDQPQESFIGYDGPCPPWNDDKIHAYRFQVLAMNVETIDDLPKKEHLTVPEVVGELFEYAIGKGEVVGTYTLNPELVSAAK